MNISERLSETTAGLRDQATAYASRVGDAARATVDLAADRVASARTPLEVLTGATLELNRLSHDYMAQLLTRQATLLQGTLAEGEKRLQRLARAGSIQQAVAGQAEDLNDISARVARNARETWTLVADAGRGVSRLAVATYAELAQPAPAARSRKPAATRRAKAGRKSTVATRTKKRAKAA